MNNLGDNLSTQQRYPPHGVFNFYAILTIVCFEQFMALITDSDKSAGIFIIMVIIKQALYHCDWTVVY